MIEPPTVDEALSDDGWILAMQEEFNQFQRNDVWDLVPKPPQKNIMGTKWVFRNKLNEHGGLDVKSNMISRLKNVG